MYPQDADINFPVKVPYTTGPSFEKNYGPVFNTNPNPSYLVAKRSELDLFNNKLYGSLDNNPVRLASKYCNLTETDSIVELALQLEEDIAIMHNGILSSICFCFPSSWLPSERVGMSLSAIHSAVADGDRLVKMSQRISELMADINQGSFIRSVWTISNSGELSQLPEKHDSKIPTTISDLYFRIETQTTAPLGNGISLFFVKVETEPLTKIWANLNKRNLLIESINSMSDAILDYKNLRHIKTLLV